MNPLAPVRSRGRRLRQFALALAGLTAACADIGPEPQFVIWLRPSEATTLTVGDSLPMTATIQGRSPCACRWGSSNAAVAPVSSEGVVRAVAPGNTTITATLVRDSTERRSLLIVVAGR